MSRTIEEEKLRSHVDAVVALSILEQDASLRNSLRDKRLQAGIKTTSWRRFSPAFRPN